MRGLLFSSIAALALCGTPAMAGHGGGGHGGHGGASTGGAATGSAATGGHGGAAAGSAAAGVGAAGSAGAASAAGSASAAGNGGSHTGTASSSTAVGVANRGGSLQPGAGFADTQIPYGSTDTSVQGGPGLGGMGGSTMSVSNSGKKNWPCYPAGQWAGSADFHAPAGCK